jgi:pyrroloquinoline quinone (PQQ) biosynthesis protein C
MFPEFLFAVHCSIRSSVPLMKAAQARARAKAAVDPVAAGIVDYLRQHIREEHDHDVWLLEDMEAVGMKRSEILRRPPPPTVAALVGAQYYWILHAHPVALFGYMAVLEGNPSSLEQINEIQVRNGLPREAFRTLIEHADIDQGHRKDLDRVVDRLPLSEQQSVLIALSAFHTIEMISRLLEEAVDSLGD